MAVRAIAFHESISEKKLAELFKTDGAQVFSGSTGLKCAHCNARFALYLPDRNHPHNSANARALEVTIAEDCNGGTHSNKEIVLQTTP
jgi:hypothetical protein